MVDLGRERSRCGCGGRPTAPGWPPSMTRSPHRSRPDTTWPISAPRSPAAPLPGGHPDVVLARAVTDGVVSADEAALIAATRLDRVDLTAAARLRGARLEATEKGPPPRRATPAGLPRRRPRRHRRRRTAVRPNRCDGRVRTVVGAASPGPGQSRPVTGTGAAPSALESRTGYVPRRRPDRSSGARETTRAAQPPAAPGLGLGLRP